MMEYLREDDTLHLHDISLLARNTADLLSTVYILTKGGGTILFHKDGIKMGDNFLTGYLFLTLSRGIAQMELEQILIRQHEEYEAAKTAGLIAGRWIDSNITRTEIAAALASGGRVRSLAADFGVSTNTLSRIMNESKVVVGWIKSN